MNNVNGQKYDAVPSPNLKFKTLVESVNIAENLSEEYLDSLGLKVVQGYYQDRQSRSQWEQRNEKVIKLALQVVEEKSFPWVGCSNVKFPLVTIAALQFLSRVAILTKGRQLVKCDSIGVDPTGKASARAARISAHMSYQLVEDDPNWIDDDEKAKFAASLVGCAFKKSYFDPVEGVNISCHVPAASLVVDYYTRDISKANRITHVIPMTSNDLIERVRRGLFCEMDERRPALTDANILLQARDDIQGLTRPAQDSVEIFEILEQHLWLDLDGDGYEEPYIAMVRSDTAQVLRLVARFFDQGDVHRKNDVLEQVITTELRDAIAEGLHEVVAKGKAKIAELRAASGNTIHRIVPQHYFTKIPFIPSPDGGFYDLGLGTFLGPLNEAVNSLINQLIDNGTMQNTAGGFLGRGVKLKGGKTTFDPFEWKPVDSNGDDLRKNIVQLPVTPPSQVLFELLGMLVQYGERISGATDIMSGVSPGQNTPAETSRNTIEQGMKIFSGIYGRMHRAFREELKKLVVLNELYLESSAKFFDLTTGEGALIARDDYRKGDFKVRPAADPAVTSETQRQQKALAVKQAAATSPGYNLYLVEKEFLEAYDIPNAEMLFPDPSGPNAVPPRPNPKVELEKAKLELQQAEFQFQQKQVQLELQIEAELQQAKIAELRAKATKELAEAQGVDTGHQIAVLNAQIGAARSHQDGILKALAMLSKNSAQSAPQQPAQAGHQGVSHGATADSAGGSQGMEATSGDTGIPM